MNSPLPDGTRPPDCSKSGLSPTLDVAVLSDLHLTADPAVRFRGADTHACLTRVLEALAVSPPDVVLLTGDLSHDGSEASYRALVSILASLGRPWYAVSGNHDDPERLACVVGVERLLDDLVVGRWRVRGLTSVVPGRPEGRLGERERRRLVDDLAHSDQDWIVALHHHPVATGSAWIDGSLLEGAREFLDLCAASGRVRAVLYGHIHDGREGRHRDLALYASPSTCLAFPHPSDALGALRAPTPTGWRRLLLHPDGRHETEVRWLPPV
jgi:Icc protein